MTRKNENQLKLSLRWAERSLESHLGKKLLMDPVTAVVELIANSWDAYARVVSIELPTDEKPFSIEDDGCGMTAAEFEERWLTMDYNRVEKQGSIAEKPPQCKKLPNREAYGRNGRGRFAAFCFTGNSYFVETHKGGKSSVHKVYKSGDGGGLLNFDHNVEIADSKKTGTRIYGKQALNLALSPDLLRGEIGMRFLHDPNFQVFVNGEQVTFEHIAEGNAEFIDVQVDDVGVIKLIAIDTQHADKDTKRHGVSWQVRNRLVGTPDRRFIDGRRTAAKRFNFVVQADCLESYVKPDWSGFKDDEPKLQMAVDEVGKSIETFLNSHSREEREETLDKLKQRNVQQLRNMSPSEVSLWVEFVDRLQLEVPSLTFANLETISGILAKLEASNSKFSLLEKLHSCSISDLDNLDKILTDWSVTTAKEVLDELRWRLRVIDDLEVKTADKSTDELHDLQPLFERGLWIFGPEFESLSFTSNRRMSTVLTEIFGLEVAGSQNRPDFIVLPDGSISLYALPQFTDFEESGTAEVVIVELKKPGVKVGIKEKVQCQKYAIELLKRGAIQQSTRVRCFLLGREIDPYQTNELNDGNISIRPFTFQTIINRAKARTLNLYEKVKDAPFFQDEDGKKFLDAGLENTIFMQQKP